MAIGWESRLAHGSEILYTEEGMAQFSVKTGQARVQADEEKRMAGELRQYGDSVRYAENHLSMKVAASANIKARLRSVAQQIEAQQGGMNSMYSALENVLNDYERAEERIYENVGGKGNLKIKSLAESILEAFRDGEQKVEDIIKQALEAIEYGSDPAGVIFRLEELKDYIAGVVEGPAAGMGLLIAVPDLVIGKINEINEQIDQIKDTIIDKTGFDVSVKKDGSLYHNELSCEHGSLGVSAGAYEAYASAEGGLFTKDDDGNLVFNPNIDAKAGASFTAAEVVGAYAVGNGMLGAAASGHITAGKVSAQAEVQGSLMDRDGNFDPHLKASASAEAILIDAEAQAGVTVLGTEAKVTGSVNVGIGAHADVEVGDGKIVCDLGVAFGLGASLSFEIDYSGTVDAVQSAAESAINGIKETVWGWISQ